MENNDDDFAEESGGHDMLRSCFHPHHDHSHTSYCVRSASIAGLAILTFLVSFYHVAFALYNRQRFYRLVFFFMAACEMAVVAAFWVEFHDVVLMFVVQFLKINQYCLMAAIYFSFASRVYYSKYFPRRLVWPAHSVVLLVLGGVLAYALVTRTTYSEACATPGWLALSCCGFFLGLMFLFGGVLLRRKFRDLPISPSNVVTLRYLWALLIVAFLASLVQFVHDLAVSFIDDCDADLKKDRDILMAATICARVLDTFLPIWAVAYVSSRLYQPPALLLNDELNEDGEVEPNSY